MAKNPGDRYQSGLENVKAIRELRHGSIVMAQTSVVTDQSNVSVGDYGLHKHSQQESGIRKVKSVPVKNNIPSLDRRSVANAAPINRSKEKTEFGEVLHQKMGFLKRYTFTCDVIVYDAVSFSMIFSSLTTKLLEWHQERSSQGVAFVMKLTCTSAVVELAKKRIDELYHSEKPYDFVKKLNVTLFIKNSENGSEDIYIPES